MRATKAVAVLGGNPVRLVIWPLLLLVVLGAVVILLFVVGGDSMLVPAFLVGGIWVYFLIDLASDLIGAFSNIGMFRASVRAVRAGLIAPDWVVRDKSCDGLAAVDEAHRLILVNGKVHSFDQVSAISQVGPRVTVSIMGEGERSVSFDDALIAGDAAERLMAVLGTVRAAAA